MTNSISKITDFLSSEYGGYSVDYVVITAGGAGMAIAAYGILTGGLSVFSGTVAGELSGSAVPISSGPGITVTENFSNGSDGWSGGTATDVFGIGYVLGPIGGSGGSESVSRTFDLDASATSSTISFDVLAMDTLDNENGYVYLDGEIIGRVNADSGEATFIPAEGIDPSISVSATVVDSGVQLGGARVNNAASNDARIAISITMDSGSDQISNGQFRLGFGSDANSGVNNESFAIDNVSVNGVRDSNATAGTSGTVSG